jgi:hypothetical protein
VAVGYPGVAVTFNGTSWGTPADVDGTSPLVSVSCPTTTFCAAVDLDGHVVEYH